MYWTRPTEQEWNVELWRIASEISARTTQVRDLTDEIDVRAPVHESSDDFEHDSTVILVVMIEEIEIHVYIQFGTIFLMLAVFIALSHARSGVSK